MGSVVPPLLDWRQPFDGLWHAGLDQFLIMTSACASIEGHVSAGLLQRCHELLRFREGHVIVITGVCDEDWALAEKRAPDMPLFRSRKR